MNRPIASSSWLRMIILEQFNDALQREVHPFDLPLRLGGTVLHTYAKCYGPPDTPGVLPRDITVRYLTVALDGVALPLEPLLSLTSPDLKAPSHRQSTSISKASRLIEGVIIQHAAHVIPAPTDHPEVGKVRLPKCMQTA
jgi:hypothetical protein